jgi:hypothetical protein
MDELPALDVVPNQAFPTKIKILTKSYKREAKLFKAIPLSTLAVAKT